jgi:hypothetical protein
LQSIVRVWNFPDLEVDCAKARGKIALTPAMAAPMAPDWRTTRRSLSITCPHVLASQFSRDRSLLQVFVLYGKQERYYDELVKTAELFLFGRPDNPAGIRAQKIPLCAGAGLDSRVVGAMKEAASVGGLGSFFVDDILYRVVKPFDEIVAPIVLSLKRTG